MAQNKTVKQGTTDDTKTIITVLLLLFVYPVGLVVMWVWTKWRTWLKILLTLPILFWIFIFISIFSIGMLSVLNPAQQIRRGECTQQCKTTNMNDSCMKACLLGKTTPFMMNQYTQDDTSEILNSINMARKERGLPLILLDDRICGYAEWLAKQYSTYGSEYATEAHKAEIVKPEIQFRYFNGYKSVYRAVTETSGENSTIGELITSKPDSNIFIPEIKNGCVYGALNADKTSMWVVFIGASQ